MPSTLSEAQWPTYRRAARTVVVVDVVESVRLMEQNEEDTVHRWQAFVGEVVTRLLPQHGGRLVKSLGDGLMLEFEAVPPAIQCAIAMQAAIAQANQGRPAEQWMCLRVGAHVADVIVDEHDIYGSGVNLAARLTTLAGPGEIVVSADLRDGLTDGLDADVEDLGECHVKHVQHMVRAYRVGSVGPDPRVSVVRAVHPDLRPTIAIIPFRARTREAADQVVGDALADEVIAALSKTAALNVVSRLSTSVFKNRDAPLIEVATRLGATYVLSGHVVVSSNRLRLTIELAEAGTGSVVWADGLSGDTRELWEPNDVLIATIVSRVSQAIIEREVERTGSQSMPTLQSYSLMLGAITLMHRTAAADFSRAHDMLEHLVERDGRHPRPHAWLANWYALKVTQGQTNTPGDDTRRALQHAHDALERDPQCSLALAIDGALQINLLKDLVAAESRFDAALASNPNEGLAWLFKAVMHAFKGEGALAEAASHRALTLSPLDPMRHYYDSLAATAALGALNYPRAIELAQRSLRANRTHPSTYRSLAIAQMLSGDPVAATETIRQLRELAADYTVAEFKVVSGFSAGPLKQLFADALESAGLPR